MGQVTEQQTGWLQKNLVILESQVHFCLVILQVVSTRASPVGAEGDNSFLPRRFKDVPVGVSNEAVEKCVAGRQAVMEVGTQRT